MSVQSKLELAQSQLQQLVQPVTEALNELPGELNAEYQRGLQEGRGEGTLPDDTIYTQVELDAAVEAKRVELQNQIDSLNVSMASQSQAIANLESSVADLQSQLANSANKFEEGKAAGKIEENSRLKAIYESEQASENEAESRMAAAFAPSQPPVEPEPQV